MKSRRAVRLSLVAVVFLLLGVMTTVGVAWGLGHPSRIAHALSSAFDPARERAPADPLPMLSASTAGVSWLVSAVYGSADGSRLESRLVVGWPMKALLSKRRLAEWGVTENPIDTPGEFISWEQGVVAPRSWQFLHDCLPVFPLWSGLLLDTIFYAAAWWVVIFAPMSLYRAGRRQVRVSRGMCGSCGYDLRGSTGGVCPECGNAG